jgi:galactokinase
MAQTNQLKDKSHPALEFHAEVGHDTKIYRAPGRVNLIGEHTDYSDGFVLPVAIDYTCWVAIAPRDDRKLIFHSKEFNDARELNLDGVLPKPKGHWSDYPVGVTWELLKLGIKLRGAMLSIVSEVPIGAGLSSSASLEVAVGFALLNENVPIDRTQLALACQRAENEFVGARCGVMDQYIACYGQQGHAVLLDCRSLTHKFIPIPGEMSLVVCNTMVKHEHAGSAYNVRRTECEEVVSRLTSFVPGIRALRDLSMEQLDLYAEKLTPLLYRRARHVVTENERTQKFALALQKNEIRALAPLMAESHRSLRDDFEVSCVELDNMVEIAAKQKGVFGARMTGGGFGGCTINLVGNAHAEEFKRNVAAEYSKQTGITPTIYICQASAGASEAVQGVALD